MSGHREVRVRVPASSANLGPGFDTLALALARYDEVEASTADDGLIVEVTGEGAGDVPLDEEHLVVRAMRAAFKEFGSSPPGLRLRCHNDVPHGRGLGSSAAAAVAGAVAAAALLGRDVRADVELLLQVAAAMEGHADNAAASLLGGFVVAWKYDGNNGDAYGAARLEPHAELRPVALIATEESSTAMTRRLLPEQVPLADAVFTASRTALGVCAFTARPELLFAATEDRLHQPYRRPAYPASASLVDRLRERGIPAVISGAGPTVLALPTDGEVPDDLLDASFTATPLAVDRDGAVVDTG
ncbi:MAG TPA: homoserine kinase [Pseudonocardia sp.]|jgi:homoserine kinase|uniref:homoserine kinase n=1 Tax=Pseudonocardia sp. TaxID=60912 RepID=UPI002C296DC3|nr:homoserine kinase [Pseudonocardia sp.]HTF49358.1 homoserine kinase [Pseudonocardia sp.]